MTTKIWKCSCSHEFQDDRYGKGKRVCTPMKEGESRCTVCGRVHGFKKAQQVKVASGK